MFQAHKLFPWKPALLFVALAGAMVGCGESVSPVTGKVTWKGEPVKGGTIIFRPAEPGNRPGSPASATVGEDGTYSLQVGANAGAVIGKNTVGYTAPEGKPSLDPGKDGELSPYANLVPTQKEVEVKTGKNEINIQLEAGPPPKKIL
jgi:hypothetical protein